MKSLGKGDKLDKYRAHFLEGTPLNEDDQLMLSRYRRVIALQANGYSILRTINTMEQETGLSIPQLYAIRRDAERLFGNINQVDREGMKYIMYENFMLAGDLARKNGDQKAMIRAYEKASELYDLFTPDQGLIDPRQFMKPVEIVYTSDPQALIDSQASETEDVEYEEA